MSIKSIDPTFRRHCLILHTICMKVYTCTCIYFKLLIPIFQIETKKCLWKLIKTCLKPQREHKNVWNHKSEISGTIYSTFLFVKINKASLVFIH